MPSLVTKNDVVPDVLLMTSGIFNKAGYSGARRCVSICCIMTSAIFKQLVLMARATARHTKRRVCQLVHNDKRHLKSAVGLWRAPPRITLNGVVSISFTMTRAILKQLGSVARVVAPHPRPRGS